jgi:hypothetical protein
MTEWWLSRTYYKRQKAHTCVRPNETRMKGKGGKDKAYGKHVDEQCRINILAAESPTKERKKQTARGLCKRSRRPMTYLICSCSRRCVTAM